MSGGDGIQPLSGHDRFEDVERSLSRLAIVEHPKFGRTRNRATGTPLSQGAAPNDLWCADFKGEFKLGNGHYCYPNRQ
jgi:hypothetical protein